MNNDRFKFRVWDKLEKRYVRHLLIGVDGLLYETADGKAISVDQDRYEREQCTGQHDRNDRPIYAGDVVVQPSIYPYFDYAEGVEHKDLNETLGEIEHDAVPNYIGIVEWDDEDCVFVIVLQCVNPNKSGISSGISYHFSDVRGLEVIGNKHEVKHE